MACATIPELGIEIRPGLDFATLTYAYCRWKGEGLFDVIFHNHPDMRLVDFLDWCYQPTVECVGCYAGDALIGLGWICQARQVAGKTIAEVGAGFFKGTPLSQWRRGLDLMVRHGFEDRGLAAMYGLTPAPNRAGAVLARCCGMAPTGVLPLFVQWQGKAVHAMIYSLTREGYRGEL